MGREYRQEHGSLRGRGMGGEGTIRQGPVKGRDQRGCLYHGGDMGVGRGQEPGMRY